VTKLSRIKADAAIDTFIASKERAGKQGERTYLGKLKPLKKFFKDRFLDTIGAAEFTAYLEQYQDGVIRNDFRKRTVALGRWAQRIGHLPRHVTLEIERTERAVEKNTQGKGPIRTCRGLPGERPDRYGSYRRFQPYLRPTARP
jgi:hypothetical protein